MIFKNPYFLLLIPIIVLLALAAWGARRNKFSAVKMPVPLPRHNTWKTILFGFLPLWGRTLALILLVLALARPQKVEKGQAPPAEGVDIMMCLDTSFSMSALDFEPYNRLDAAKNAASDFVKKRTNDRIGMVVFGGTALLACPLTLDYQSLLEFIDSAYINMTKAEGTAIGDALLTSVNHLKNSKAKSKVIILLTDGRSNTGVITDPVAAARTAGAYDIKIYAIGTAGKGQAKIPTGDPFQPYAYIKDDLDEGTLMEVAKITGGEFYRAANYFELQKVYSIIDSLEKTEFKVKSLSNYTDIFLVFLLPALALLTLLFMVEKTFLRTIP